MNWIVEWVVGGLGQFDMCGGKSIARIYKQWKSDLDNSWECFMCEKSELSCWNLYNGSQWGTWFFHCHRWDLLGNKSKSIPHTGMRKINHTVYWLGIISLPAS